MRRRILVTIVVVTTLAVAAFFVPAALAISSRVERRDLLELHRETGLVAARLAAVTGAGELARAVDELDGVVADGHDVAVYGLTGELVAGDGPRLADSLVQIAAGGVLAEGTVDGELVAAARVQPGVTAPELVVRVSEPASASRQRVIEDVALLAVAALAVIAVAAVVGALLARRLSRPLEDLGAWATSLGRHPSQPPPARSGIAEIDELGDSLTQAEQRIAELLQRERSFSSHVAHQLRTPVAAMRIAVEAELDAPRPDASAVLHESLGALDRLESTITSLLALGRHDERETVDCDVAAAVRAHAQRWEPTFAGAGRELSIGSGTVVARVDPAAVRHVVDVLLDNALRHGSGRVEVAVRRGAEQVEIDIADEGSGGVDRDPFSERRAASSHGIGLRLARTLAESEGGGLQLLDRPTTVFRLSLPDERLVG